MNDQDPMFYAIHQMEVNGETNHIGTLAILAAPSGRIEVMQFRYEEEYLNQPYARPLSPVNIELSPDPITFHSDGKSFVGVIDDLLPDDWGKKIIAKRLNKKYITDLDALEFIGGGVSIGATKITALHETPNWDNGMPIADTENILTAIFSNDISNLTLEELEAAALVKGGSQTGGARPKMLVLNSEGKPCLIKPDQKHDEYSFAALEWAALEVCRMAGLPTAVAVIYTLNNSISSLMIERFDISEEGGRYHLITINTLMKDPDSQMDALLYSYEDIADCIRKYSYQPTQDVKQLFGQLLINQALLNSDDHLRNFSMIRDKIGWKLSPVYDVVTQQTFRSEHACEFNGSGFLPHLSEYKVTGKKLQLRGPDIEEVYQRVSTALKCWKSLLESQSIHDETLLNIPSISNPDF